MAKLAKLLEFLFSSSLSDPALYNLGEIPSELSEIQWPTLPSVQQTVEVSNKAQWDAVRDQDHTEIRVVANISENLVLKASDVRIVIEDGVSIGDLDIDRGEKRVEITGGQILGSLSLRIPNDDPDLLVTDVWIHDIHVVEQNGEGNAMNLRGHRIAVTNSSTDATNYCAWVSSPGDPSLFTSTDIIFAGNNFVTEGDEACIRMTNIERVVLVDNRLEATRTWATPKCVLRFHGESDLLYAGRNTLIATGLELGSQDWDYIGRVYFEDNSFYQTHDNLFIHDHHRHWKYRGDRIDYFYGANNLIYSELHSCFFEPCDEVPDHFELINNVIIPKTPEPPK
jgi:hypothetical protein